jgi:RNA polymerase sigma-70 factor (ECF subfamily)
MKTEDQTAFTAGIEAHRRELQLHCYRMLGSLDDSEDLVQETFLRAWRSRATFTGRGRGSLRAWLYRIATNACLDALARKPRRVLASQLGPPHDPADDPPPPLDVAWLQPYPDRLLEGIAPVEDQPDAAVVRRETVEIAFLATIQLLPPRQRAVLMLRDVLGWSAKETGELLDASAASVNSALQRARASLNQRMPGAREEWSSAPDADEERRVLERYVDAFERGEVGDVAALLADDLRADMPPHPFWFEGRDANVRAMTPGFDPASPQYMGEWRAVITGANLQPAAAFYNRRPGESAYKPFALDVLRVRDGKVTAITAFDAEFFPAFGLPRSL